MLEIEILCSKKAHHFQQLASALLPNSISVKTSPNMTDC